MRQLPVQKRSFQSQCLLLLQKKANRKEVGLLQRNKSKNHYIYCNSDFMQNIDFSVKFWIKTFLITYLFLSIFWRGGERRDVNRYLRVWNKYNTKNFLAVLQSRNRTFFRAGAVMKWRLRLQQNWSTIEFTSTFFHLGLVS